MKKFRIISFVMAAMLCVFMSCEREEPVSVEFKAPSYQLKVGETMDIIAELVIRHACRFGNRDAIVKVKGFFAHFGKEIADSGVISRRAAQCSGTG